MHSIITISKYVFRVGSHVWAHMNWLPESSDSYTTVELSPKNHVVDLAPNYRNLTFLTKGFQNYYINKRRKFKFNFSSQHFVTNENKYRILVLS
jgi:hypothetical protein